MLQRRSRRDRERARRAAASRRWRQRVRAGKAVYPVEGDAEITDMLVRTRWLADREVHGRTEVGQAIARLLKDMARGSKKIP